VSPEAPPLKLPIGRKLTPSERVRLTVEVAAAYLRAWWELRRVPIASVVERLRAASPARRAGGAEALNEARRLGWVVVRILRFLPGDTRCLRRSLVLTQLLERRGISARLVIGARGGPDFLAHAWVEHEGQPVLSTEGDAFGRLVEL
jgi:transglutaminase superfamily protein